jgi:hypothetical protein
LRSGSVSEGPRSPPYAATARNTRKAPSRARSFWNWVMSIIRAIWSVSFQNEWMKNALKNRNTAIIRALRLIQMPAARHWRVGRSQGEVDRQ